MLFSVYYILVQFLPEFFKPFLLLLTVSSANDWEDHTLKSEFDAQFKYVNFIHILTSFKNFVDLKHEIHTYIIMSTVIGIIIIPSPNTPSRIVIVIDSVLY